MDHEWLPLHHTLLRCTETWHKPARKAEDTWFWSIQIPARMVTGKVRAKKHLGQHFLKDKKIAASIVESLRADNCDTVVEIGPGMGVLTQFLVLRKFKSLKVVEIDREAVEYLRNNISGIDEIISGDFLELDFEELGRGRMAVIGNFPYNISSQIFFRILENRNKIT